MKENKLLKVVTFTEDNIPCRLEIHYGFTHFAGQLPYFSITADFFKYSHDRRNPDACGCLHDMIAKHCPSLKPLIETHLTDITGTPMHFKANGAYFYINMLAERWGITETNTSLGIYPRKSYEQPYEKSFREHCALHDDEPTPELCAFSTNEVSEWLDKRLSIIQKRFTDLWIKFDLVEPVK